MQPSPNTSSAPMHMTTPVPGRMPMTPMMPMMPMMPKNIQLARAYIPDQPYEGLFPLNEALMKGTIFPNLYQPYVINNK